MKRNLRILLLLLVCVFSCMVTKDYAFATSGADTTAPEVTKVTMQTTEITKPDIINLAVDVVEMGTGVKDIEITLYGYVDGKLEILSGGLYSLEKQYSGTVDMNISVTNTDASATYYVGQIDVSDYSGNTRSYWNTWNVDGYNKDDVGYYINDSFDNTKKCYIENGGTVYVQPNEQDSVKVSCVNSIQVHTLSVDKGGKISFTLQATDVDNISKIFVVFAGYKGKQYVSFSNELKWIVQGEYLLAEMEVPLTATSGTYYITNVIIDDYLGNSRQYYNTTGKCEYLLDEDGNTYVPDMFNTEYKCYIQNAATVSVLANGDDESPIVTDFKFLLDNVKKPGVLPVELNIIDDSKICSIMISLYYRDGDKLESFSHSENYNEGISVGKVKIDIPIGTDCPSGTYYLGQLEIKDMNGNTRSYWDGWRKEGYLFEDTKAYLRDTWDDNYRIYIDNNKTVLIEDEFDVAFEVGLSNPALLMNINDMPEGQAGKILIDREGVASKEVFEAIKGKNKTLVFYKNNYQWIFNGLDIKTPKAVRLNIDFNGIDGSDYGFNDKLLKITFEKNGELPGKANVRIKSDYTYQIFKLTNVMYLYYLDEDKIELESDSGVKYVLDGTDHWCQFDISHNSVFVVSGEKANDNLKITKLSISGMSKKLAAGKKMKLSITVKPIYATNRSVKWTSNNKKYATVNSKGVVTAKKAGIGKKVKITATAKDGSKKKATYTITIMKDSVKSIKLKASKKSVKAGQSVKVKPTIKTTGSKVNKTLKWTSSNTKYATVNSKGKVTTKKAGKGKTVKITAQSTDGSNKKAWIKIKIK